VKLLLVGMESNNLFRTECIIKHAIRKNFDNIELYIVDLLDYIKNEGCIVANEFLYNERAKLAPDIVLYSGVEALDVNNFSNYNLAKQIIWFYDAPFHVNVCKFGNLVDHLFITAQGLVEDYKYWGVDCHWLLEGIHDPPHLKRDQIYNLFETDIAFVGTPDMRRNTLLERVHCEAQGHLKIWGSPIGPPYFGLDDYTWHEQLPYSDTWVDGGDYPYLCSSAKIILGINIYNDIYQYFSNRNLFTMGCGGFLLTHYVPGMEELFINHQHLVWYKDFDECIYLINYYLKHEEKRQEIQNNAFLFAHENYSMTQQLQKMFNICGIEMS